MNFLTDTGVGVGLTDGRNIYAGSSSCSSESGQNRRVTGLPFPQAFLHTMKERSTGLADGAADKN